MTMTQYITDSVLKAEQIAEHGIEILDELQSITLLNTLAIEYQSFILVMESRDKFLPLECLKGKLIEEKARERERPAKCDIENTVYPRIVPIDSKCSQQYINVTIHKRK